jgi:hypothetical protein
MATSWAKDADDILDLIFISREICAQGWDKKAPEQLSSLQDLTAWQYQSRGGLATRSP